MINYRITRGSKDAKTAAHAVIKGLAEDKGLFVPDAIPALQFKPEEMVCIPYK